jgi:hypothetical protein
MKLFIIVHRDDNALDRFLDAVRQERLVGFTRVASSGWGRSLTDAPSDFTIGSIGRLLTGDSNSGTTAFSIVPDERLPRLLELLHREIPNIEEPGQGVWALLPVEAGGGMSRNLGAPTRRG